MDKKIITDPGKNPIFKKSECMSTRAQMITPERAYVQSEMEFFGFQQACPASKPERQRFAGEGFMATRW